MGEIMLLKYPFFLFEDLAERSKHRFYNLDEASPRQFREWASQFH
jgi:hypothetical protein